MPLFRAIPPSSKSMASGRNGGKEGAAEASDMGKGNRYDMGKGWHLVPKQPSLPPPLQAEAHQREATKERMTQIAVSKGKGTAGGVEGFDDLGPLALPRVGKAQEGAQGVEGKGKDPKGKRQEGLSTEPSAKRQRQPQRLACPTPRARATRRQSRRQRNSKTSNSQRSTRSFRRRLPTSSRASSRAH